MDAIKALNNMDVMKALNKKDFSYIFHTENLIIDVIKDKDKYSYLCDSFLKKHNLEEISCTEINCSICPLNLRTNLLFEMEPFKSYLAKQKNTNNFNNNILHNNDNTDIIIEKYNKYTSMSNNLKINQNDEDKLFN